MYQIALQFYDNNILITCRIARNCIFYTFFFKDLDNKAVFALIFVTYLPESQI